MRCPECGGPLQERWQGLYEDIPVHGCRACGGAFYPAGSLGRLDDNVCVDAEDLDYAPAPRSGSLSCPRCRTAEYRGSRGATMAWVAPPASPLLVLARCPECDGFWLRPGDLDRIRGLVLRLD